MQQLKSSSPVASPTWRIAVVDDHSIIRAVFRTLVEDDPNLQFLWSASTLDEARGYLSETPPDMLIVDISLPDGEGYDLIPEAFSRRPDLRVLVVSSYEDVDHAWRALDCGAHGYLTKNSSPGDILEAISSIQKGGTSFKILPRHR